MKKICLALVLFAMMYSSTLGQKKEQGRLENAWRVMKEILDIADDMPQSVIVPRRVW